MESIYESSKQLLLECSSQINGALVYLDSGSSEVIHAAIGVSVLFGIGALNVCDLQRSAPADALLPEVQGRRVEVLTMMVTQLLPDSHPLIIKAIMAHPHVKVCYILSSITEHAHACLGVTDVEAYAEYSTRLRQEVAELSINKDGSGIDRVPPEVHIRHLPLTACPLGPTTFVLPAASAAAQLAVSGERAAGWGPHQARDDEDAAGATSDVGLSLLAHTLAGLVSLLGNSLNIFHVGSTSQHIAHELATLPLPSNRMSDALAGDHPVALVLIDRALDLVTPATPTDHPVDCMLAQLPRSNPAPPPRNRQPGTYTNWRSVDIRADGSPFCPLHLPGAPLMGLEVLRPSDTHALQWMEQLLNRKGKDAAALLRKWLKEGLRQEGLAPPIRSKMGAVPPSELQALAEALASSSGARVRQACAMSLGFAGAQALGGDASAAWEATASLTKQVLQARYSGMDVGQLLLDVLEGLLHGKSMVGVQEVVQLLAASYSLAGDKYQSVPTVGPEDERTLKAKLVEAIMLPASPTGVHATEGVLKDFCSRVQKVHQAADDEASRESELKALRREAEGIVSNLFNSLQFAAGARRQLRELHTLATGTPQDAQAVVPLICQVVDKILRDEGGDDLVHVTSQLRGLLSLGLGHLGLKHNKPKPADSSTVLIFVVGGISLVEVREVYQELALHLGARPRFVLAGTSLVTPADVASKLCGV